ncbi:hypothetical protein Ocin01_08212 [Orchesella cincta]|uniref:Uncharacterized protein n=1 Tax=Orchesella cincta TaxID=48709 RepID=A0A1D2MZK0_ORCCI|nr:hypothetical protein Ocin01_08212 [Orchesella cincta]
MYQYAPHLVLHHTVSHVCLVVEVIALLLEHCLRSAAMNQIH